MKTQKNLALVMILLGVVALFGVAMPSDVDAAAGVYDFAVQGNRLPTTLNGDYDFNGNVVGAIPAAQTIAAGGIIAADACGGVKLITAAGAVTTDTTHSFTEPTAALAGCCMVVFNSGGTNTITIDANTTILVGAAANLAVTALDALTVCCDGTNWRQVTALLSNN